MRRAVLPLLLGALVACGGPAAVRPEPLPAATPSTGPSVTVEPAGRVVPLDGEPRGVVAAADGRSVAVALAGPDRLDVLALPDLRVLRSVALPSPPLGLAAGGAGELLVATEDGLVAVDGTLVEPAVEVTGGSRAVAGVGDYRVVVGDRVTVLEGDERVGADRGRVAPVAVAGLGGRRAAVVDAGELSLTVYALPRAEVVATVTAGEGPTGVVALPGDRLAVVDTRGQSVLLLDTGPLFLRQRLPVRGGPFGAAVDASTGGLWVTLSGRNEAVGYTTATGALREVERLATVQQPELVAAAAGRLLVASPRTRQLQLVEP